MTAQARIAAAVVALVAAITLLARLVLKVEETGSVGAALSYLSQFFTLLTNTLVLAMMIWIARGRPLPAPVVHAITIAIICVGLLYHLLLAHLVSLEGAALWADHGTHTFVPVLTALWWLAYAEKPPFRARDMAVWVAWPLVYCGYILIRAQYSGFYPYPFLDLPTLGASRLVVNLIALSAAFIAVGLGLLALGRLVPPPGPGLRR